MKSSQHSLPQVIVIVLAVNVLATSVRAVNREWVSGDGKWSNPANWTGNAVPGIGDEAFLGFGDPPMNDVENALVLIDQPAFVDQLWIEDGMHAFNRDQSFGDIFPITIDGSLTLQGENQVDGSLRHSTLFLRRGPGAYDLDANAANVFPGSRVELRRGAIVNLHNYLWTLPSSSNSAGEFRGHGILNLTSAGTTLENGGVIDPRGEMTINQQGGGLYDLDGRGEAGELWIGGSIELLDTVNDHLTINGSALTDSFSGTILLANDRHLTMNLSEGWIADAESMMTFGIDGATNKVATINGSHVTLEGEVRLIAPQVALERAAARFNANATVNPGATISLETDAQLQFAGTTTINGGEFTLADGFTDLLFLGPATVRGGTFETHSDSHQDGLVSFRDPTEWDGEVTINGVARQMDDATVSGLTIIDALRFDMDGVPGSPFQADWQVNSNLVVNAENINLEDDNVFGSEITIAGNALGRLNMNLAGGQWTMAGTLNLNNDLPFGATRLAGSKLWLLGEANVSGADIRINADTAFGAGSTTSFADADSSLTMRKHSRVYAEAQFVGDGLLHNAVSGHMILDDGASTDDVGVRNAGVLDIDDAAGIATVEWFENENSGTLAIDLGGYLLGEEFDHLQVSGEALLDGTLAIDLLTKGMIGDGLFTPQIGDEFIILTSLDGVSGEFADVLPTIADGNTYGWEVLYHPHDVTVRLANVVPEPATLPLLAFGLIGLVSRRR